MGRFAFVLEDRVERHREEAARHRDADQVHENAPASRRAQEDRHARQFCDRRTTGAGHVQVPGEERHRGGSDGHVTRAHLAVQQPLGHNRSDADTYGEEREHHRHDLLVREEHVFGKRRQARHDGRAEQPEPGHGEDRQHQRRARRHVTDDGDCVAHQARTRPIGNRGWRRRDLTRGEPACERSDNAAPAHDEGSFGEQDHAATEDRAQQDREECARFDQGVAGDQFVLA